MDQCRSRLLFCMLCASLCSIRHELVVPVNIVHWKSNRTVEYWWDIGNIGENYLTKYLTRQLKPYRVLFKLNCSWNVIMFSKAIKWSYAIDLLLMHQQKRITLFNIERTCFILTSLQRNVSPLLQNELPTTFCIFAVFSRQPDPNRFQKSNALKQ